MICGPRKSNVNNLQPCLGQMGVENHHFSHKCSYFVSIDVHLDIVQMTFMLAMLTIISKWRSHSHRLQNEKERFCTYLELENLRVLPVFSLCDEKLSDQFFRGYLRQNTELLRIRMSAKATDQKRLYEQLKQQAKYSALPSWTKREKALAKLEQWESGNAEVCTLQPDDGVSSVFKEGTNGDLTRYTRFLFIPAVMLPTMPGGKGFSYN